GRDPALNLDPRRGGRDDVVAGPLVAVDPVFPAARRHPEAVDENDGLHEGTSFPATYSMCGVTPLRPNSAARCDTNASDALGTGPFTTLAADAAAAAGRPGSGALRVFGSGC